MVHKPTSIGMGFVTPAITAGAAGGPVGIAIAAAAVGIQIALQKLFSRKGPQQRIQATQIVNEAEVVLQQNVAEWNSSYKTKEEQAKHVAAFDYAWGEVVRLLSDPNLGNPGKVGIEERTRGGKWDWFAAYRDPIANDSTKTYGDVWDQLMGGTGESGGSNLALYAGIGLMVLGIIFMGGRK